MAEANNPKFLSTGTSGDRGTSAYSAHELCPRRGARNRARRLGEAQGLLEPSRPSLAALTGTLIHDGLAHHYSHLQAHQRGEKCSLASPQEAIDHAWQIGVEKARPEDRSVWDEARETATPVLRGYLAHYRIEAWEILHVEKIFRIALGKSPLTMRVDLVVRDRAGKVWLVDHKTAASISPRHPWMYSLSLQMHAYEIMGHTLFKDEYGGIQLNFIQTKGPEKFSRPELIAMPGIVASLPDRIEAADLEMRALASVPPEKWPIKPSFSACNAYGQVCPFFADCRTF